MPASIDPFGLPPEEAVNWFRAKGLAVSWNWQDVWQQQHQQAFTVAKAMQSDLLADLKSAVDDAIANGTTLAAFRKNLKPTLVEKGWWGKQEVTDPTTGAKKLVTLGTPRRLKIIYDTNLRQTHSAGRWERIQRVKATRPYLRYVHRFGKQRSPHARPQHQKWHNLVRPVDDPCWDHIMPMNGWGCCCKVQSVNERDLARYGLQVSPPPQLEQTTWVNPKTGDAIRVTKGVDPGFDYNPGKKTFDPNTSTPKPTPPASSTPAAPSPTPSTPANADPTKTPEHWAEHYRQKYGDAADQVGYGRALHEQAKDMSWDDAYQYAEQMRSAGVPGFENSTRSLELMKKYGEQTVRGLYKRSADEAECARLLVAHTQSLEQRSKIGVPRLSHERSQSRLNDAAKWYERFSAKSVTVPSVSWRIHQSPTWRAYIYPEARIAHMGVSSGVGTWVHEWGHAVEVHSPGVVAKVRTFRAARETGAKPRRLSEVTGLGYGNKELTREDKYWDPYVGKVYDTDSSEFVSSFTGYLADGKGAEILAKDPESFYFGLGVLAGR